MIFFVHQLSCHSWPRLARSATQGRRGLPILCLALSLLSCPAASWFVRPGAAGANSGADWNNAWTNLSGIAWGSLAAGDTVFLAGGLYPDGDSASIAASGTSNAPLNLVRVRSTDAAATNAAGWNAAFDAPVILTNAFYGLYWNAGNTIGNYITVDGRVPSGIIIHVVESFQGYDTAGIRLRTQTIGVVLTNLEVAGPGVPGGYPFMNDMRAVDLTPASGQPGASSFLVSHCRLHGVVDGVYLGGSANGIIEHCQIYDIHALTATNGLTQHDNVCISIWPSGITFRFNEIWDWNTEGIMLTSSGVQSNWKIYGNLWHDPSPSSTARVLESQNVTNGPVWFNNNTMAGTWIPVRTGNGGAWSNDSQGRNNIYWRCPGGPGLPDEANNLTSSAFPFVSVSDFHLAAGSPAIGQGATLAAEYAIDFDGNPRTPPWDIGAYASTNKPPVHSVIAPPANLRLAGP